MSSVGGQRPRRSGGWPVLSDSGSDVSQNITAPSLERRIMKKLNKVASLFATAALAASVSRARLAQTVDRQLGQRHRHCRGRTARTNSAGAMASGRPPPRCRGCDGALAAAPPPRPRRPRRPGPAPRARPGSGARPGSVVAAPTSEKVTFAADAFFDFDKAVLKPEGKAKLDDLVSKMNGINLEVIIAVGHTDSVGTDAYNQKLSVRRAEAVKAYLVEQGRREEPRLHRRQGREAAGRRQQDRRRPREEPSRGNRSGRHARQVSAAAGASLDRKNPARRGFFVLRRCAYAIRYHRSTINADPQELAKFSELAHRWWDPESEFRPLHQINPLRLDWIDAHAPLARQARARRRLRRRHPGRIDGARAAPTCSASTSPTKPLKVAQLHALEAGRRDVDYREVAAEALAAEQPGELRRRHLHGDARARARSGVDRARLRGARQAGRLGVLLDASTATPKAFVFAIVGAEYVLQAAAARARTNTPSSSARASSPRWCRAAGLELDETARHGIQPADAALLAVGRHQRQLPGRLPQAGMTVAAPDAARRAVRSRRHADRQRARPGRRRQRHARRARPARRCRTSACGRWSARARAAWSASRSASRPATPATTRCATSSSRATRRA